MEEKKQEIILTQHPLDAESLDKIEKLPPLGRNLSIVLNNNSKEKKDVTILNPTTALQDIKTSQPEGIEVLLAQGKYNGLLLNMLVNTYQSNSLKIRAKNWAQFNNIIQIGYQNDFGKREQYVLDPLQYLADDQKDKDGKILPDIPVEIIIKDFRFMLYFESFFTVPVNAGERVTFVFGDITPK